MSRVIYAERDSDTAATLVLALVPRLAMLSVFPLHVELQENGMPYAGNFLGVALFIVNAYIIVFSFAGIIGLLQRESWLPKPPRPDCPLKTWTYQTTFLLGVASVVAAGYTMMGTMLLVVHAIMWAVYFRCKRAWTVEE